MSLTVPLRDGESQTLAIPTHCLVAPCFLLSSPCRRSSLPFACHAALYPLRCAAERDTCLPRPSSPSRIPAVMRPPLPLPRPHVKPFVYRTGLTDVKRSERKTEGRKTRGKPRTKRPTNIMRLYTLRIIRRIGRMKHAAMSEDGGNYTIRGAAVSTGHVRRGASRASHVLLVVVAVNGVLVESRE